MQGQWIVVDSVPKRTMSLLQVGDTYYKDASVRKNLSQAARLLLRGRLEKAVSVGEPFEAIEDHAGQSWHVVVRPILSPHSEHPVGALGIYVAEGEELPPAPLVGSMEWVIMPSGERFSQWDQAMYKIYDLDVADPTVGEVSPAIWLGKFVAQEDQDRLQKLIAEGLETPVSNRAVISYHVLTSPERSKKLLEMSVRKYVEDDGRILLRGITREVSSETSTEDVLPAEVDAPDSAVEAMAELTQDIPLAQLDFRDWRLFQVSRGWATAGLGDPQENSLLELLHSDSQAQVRAALEGHSENQHPGVIAEVELRMGDGSYRKADLMFKVLPHRYAMVRVRVT